MRAVLSKTPGGPETLVVEDVLDPTPKPGELVIEVKAVGINYPDTLIIEDKYQFRPERPFSPGAEVAGVVEAVGEGVKGVAKGDRVIAVPGWGGLVERLAVRAETVIPMPEAMSFEEAAATTRAPMALPSSTAAAPTPPAAPSTSRVSPGFSCARSFRV